jgi:hypothetical protein
MTQVVRALVAFGLAGLFGVAAAEAASPPRLIGTVGFGQITFKNEAGLTIKTLKAGRYSVSVVDRSATQNFHLRGTGINLLTGIAFEGTESWTVRFRKGTTIKYYSDHASKSLRGSFTIKG